MLLLLFGLASPPLRPPTHPHGMCVATRNAVDIARIVCRYTECALVHGMRVAATRNVRSNTRNVCCYTECGGHHTECAPLHGMCIGTRNAGGRYTECPLKYTECVPLHGKLWPLHGMCRSTECASVHGMWVSAAWNVLPMIGVRGSWVEGRGVGGWGGEGLC